MKFSIITATFNAAKVLPGLIDSLRQQTNRDFEWIVIDGASTDGTRDLLRKNEDIISHWISEPDKGIYDAWNKGVAKAQGEWVLFVGADDRLWSPNVLAEMSEWLSGVEDRCRVVYGKVMLLDGNGAELYPIGEPWKRVRSRFLSVMCLPHTATFHHRSLFLEYGNFDSSFRIVGDYEFLLRELVSHDAKFAEDVIVAGMLTGGLSSNPATSECMLLEIRRATRMHGRLFPGMPWLVATVRHIIRKLLWGVVGETSARRLLDFGRRMMGKPAHWTKT